MIILTEKDYQELIEENRKLNEEIENHKQNIMQDELEIIPRLEEENKKLKEELREYKKMFEGQLKEVYIKNTAEFLDKKFPKVN